MGKPANLCINYILHELFKRSGTSTLPTATTTSTLTGLQAPKLGGLSLPQSTATTTAKPAATTAALGLGLGLGLQTLASSGTKPNGLTTTTTSLSGTGTGLGGLKLGTAAPPLGLTTATTTTASTQKTTEIKGLGGVGAAEIGQSGAGRDR